MYGLEYFTIILYELGSMSLEKDSLGLEYQNLNIKMEVESSEPFVCDGLIDHSLDLTESNSPQFEDSESTNIKDETQADIEIKDEPLVPGDEQFRCKEEDGPPVPEYKSMNHHMKEEDKTDEMANVIADASASDSENFSDEEQEGNHCESSLSPNSETDEDLDYSRPNTNGDDISVCWVHPYSGFKPKFSLPKVKPPKVLAAIDRLSIELEAFQSVFPKSLFIFIAECTNERLAIYNTTKKKKVPKTDASEIMLVLGISFVMCYNKVPNQSCYWSSHLSLSNDVIKNAISRDRFQLIMSNLYFNHPHKPQHCNKLYYIEEVMNCFKYTFPKRRTDSTFQSINELTTKFNGRSSLKQHLLARSIKRGLSVWLRCDSRTGYTYDLTTIDSSRGEGATETLGGRVVNNLCQTIRIPSVTLSFDRFFTSVKLLTHIPFAAVGTCIRTRPNLPPFFTSLQRGETEYRVDSSSGITAARWMDSNEVILLSNCHEPKDTTVKRKQKDGTQVDVNCPVSIAFYNEIMGGVDLADQKIGTYDFNRNSTKWWKKVFFKLLMMAAVNAQVLFQKTHHKKLTLLDFLVPLAEQMIGSGRLETNIVKRKRGLVRVSKRPRHMINIGDHMPIAQPGRRRCVMCSSSGVEKRTHFICSMCQLPLCTPCFAPYHSSPCCAPSHS